ncbi:MAG: nitric oxide reductase activation protein [Candidatus Choladocola sp.]|nr:nitric oxide reductase activation protein [Candidatus Choladocola sp.]
MITGYEGYDLQAEAENRIRNLMWTVSGNYQLNTKIDMASYCRSKYISMYDAVKQGAFARFFSKDELGMYLVKKVFCGGQEQPLTELAQLCVDAAVYRKIAAERPGVPELRAKAFSDLLELSYSKMSSSLTGMIKIALLRGYLTDNWGSEKRIAAAVEKITKLENASDTMSIIRVTDELYNTLIDKSFVRKHGDLESVLSVTTEELQEYDWRDFLEEELNEDLLEQILNKMNSQVVTLQDEAEEEKEEKRATGQQRVRFITEEAAARMYSYIELNYGRSYLTEQEQKRINRQLCSGAHADCSLYFTDGILQNPVISNAQYVNARRHAEKNRVMFRNSRNMLVRNIEQLTDELKRSLCRRSEPEDMSSWSGAVVPRLLWKVGKMEDPGRLFRKTNRRNHSDFVVDILMDASGSQRDRQSQVALQAYMISEALSNNGVPHRITSFCSFWDYTILQRFREYDAPREDNIRILDYVTSANNRDGLAIRAAGDGLMKRREGGKILIVLSDGRPNDIIVNRPDSRNPRPYYGEYAVKDTAYEVRRLRSSGVCVLGVFTGKEKDLAAEKKIFGKDFAYIRSIDSFSKVVGRYLRKLLEEDSGNF